MHVKAHARNQLLELAVLILKLLQAPKFANAQAAIYVLPTI
jgi:hypothetical protein